jgi:hypothetical protein
MLLRSGTVKNNKCKECNEFHSYKKFKFLCSNCFHNNFPTLARKFINTNSNIIPRWDKNLTGLLLKKYTIPLNHAYWKALVHMFKTNSIFRQSVNDFTETNYINFLHTIKRSKSIKIINNNTNDISFIVNIRGITAKQGKILTDIVRKNYPNDSPNKHWKAQHAICGLIMDRWNINLDDHGGVGYCYYGMGKSLPETTIPWDDFSIPAAFLKPTNNDNKIRIELWKKNLPTHEFYYQN